MKTCIGCGKNNSKGHVLFVGAQCSDCYAVNPIVYSVGISYIKDIISKSKVYIEERRVKKEKKIKVKKIYLSKRRICEGCGGWTNGGTKCFRCIKVKNVRVIDEVRVKVCKVCGKMDGDGGSFRRYFRKGVECVYSQHEKCGSIIVVNNKRVKGGVKGKRGRKGSGLSLAEKIFNLPDFKEYLKCGENKSINDYYTSRGLPYAICKVCHRIKLNKWKSKNREKYLAYLRDYNKGYDRRVKRKGIGLPNNEV